MPIMKRILEFLGFRKSIATRLAEACAATKELAKRGDNGEYKYLRIVDVADALRMELFSRGIVVIPNDVECKAAKWKSADFEGRVITEVCVKTEFTVTDGQQSLVFAAYGVGRDMDGKALFQAQTGALKSWLKRLGLIFGEREDPEVEQSKPAPAEVELPRQKVAQARYQARAWAAGIATSGKTEAEIEEILSRELGRPVTSATIIALPSEGFDIAMQILTKHSDLTGTLAESTRQARSRRKSAGPQPVVAAMDRAAADEVMTGD